MYKAFPCSDYYESSVVISDIQRPTLIAFRHSDLDNLRLDMCKLLACRLFGCDFHLFPLIAAAGRYCSCVDFKCREATYHPTTFITIFRRNYFDGRKIIVQSIQTSSLQSAFSLAAQS